MSTCEVCGASSKNAKYFYTRNHKNTKRHRDALKGRGKVVDVSSRAQVLTTSRGTSVPITGIEHRVSLLEDQIKFIMSKINAIDLKLVNYNPRTSSISDLSNIKMKIKQLIQPGESISIDDLIKYRELQQINWEVLEKALVDLVDEEIFDVSEGKSKKKIAGSIGRLIRR